MPFQSISQLLQLIARSKTVLQIHQIHSKTIICTANPSILLPKLLYKLTSLFNSNTNTSTKTNTSTSLSYALRLFNQIPAPTTFTFNTIIRAHTLLSSPLHALSLFNKMRRASFPPDSHTFPFILKACAQAHMYVHVSLGHALHGQVIRCGFGHDIFVSNTLLHCYVSKTSLSDAYNLFGEINSNSRDVISYNVLIYGFIKGGQIERARDVFDKMHVKDVVSYSTILTGYAQMNQCGKAIELWNEMVELGIKIDNVGLASVLSACAQLGALAEGKDVHGYIVMNNIRVDEFLLTGLVDMYAKCGCIDIAKEMFESSSEGNRNLFTWNAMVVGLAMHGHGECALEYFYRMRDATGVKQDGISFLGALVGCSHAGLVKEARQLFNEMECVYGVQRELKHYGCMVDLLGRAGFVKEALKMIEIAEMKGDIYVWGGLLGGCRIHGNVDVAEIAAAKIIELDPEDHGVYKIMATIYANAKRWDDATKMKHLMDVRVVYKNGGCSLIQLDGKSHEFIAGDKSHPQVDDIYMALDGIWHHQLE